jgi:hypothetical protein
MVPQRRIERRFPPYQSGALPLDDCGKELMEWCWLEDSNLPPLAYEASALPDELSQLLENRQKDRGAAPGVEATLSGAPRLGAASKSGRSRCQRARRRRRRSHRHARSWARSARKDARAQEHTRKLGFWSVGSAGHLPSCLSGGGLNPAPVIPVSAASCARSRLSNWRSPNRRTRPRAADRSVDPTVPWRR